MKLNLQVSRFSRVFHSGLKFSIGLCWVSASCNMRSWLLSHQLSQWWNGNICVICRDIFLRPLISLHVYHRRLPLLLITKSNLGAKGDNTSTKIRAQSSEWARAHDITKKHIPAVVEPECTATLSAEAKRRSTAAKRLRISCTGIFWD